MFALLPPLFVSARHCSVCGGWCAGWWDERCTAGTGRWGVAIVIAVGILLAQQDQLHAGLTGSWSCNCRGCCCCIAARLGGRGNSRRNHHSSGGVAKNWGARRADHAIARACFADALPYVGLHGSAAVVLRDVGGCCLFG